MKFGKRTLKESDTTSLAGPVVGSEAGLATLLIDSINGEWDTVNLYNSIAITAREAGFDYIAEVLDEINTEENKHIGQLQEILKTISPNATAIADGEKEAEEMVDDDVFEEGTNKEMGKKYDKTAEEFNELSKKCKIFIRENKFKYAVI